MDPHSKAPKKNTSHGNELQQQDTTHLLQVWTCLLFIRSGQNHLTRNSEGGKKTKQKEEEVGRQHQGMGRPGVRKVAEGSGEQEKKEETGC